MRFLMMNPRNYKLLIPKNKFKKKRCSRLVLFVINKDIIKTNALKKDLLLKITETTFLMLKDEINDQNIKNILFYILIKLNI